MRGSEIVIIGAGGVGSWLVPAMCKLVDSQRVTVIDGDVLEEKNLDRQLFRPDQVGQNKAHALAEVYPCNSDSQYYSAGYLSHNRSDFLFCCADNNAARLAVLEACDQFRCQCIIAANELHSAEAYHYRPSWRDSHVDPRIYYPELLNDDGADPIHRRIGCTGEAQEERPQLVSANFAAASLAQALYVLWGMEVPKMGASTKEAIPFLPYRYRQNLASLEFDRVGDLTTKQTTERTV